MTSSLQKVLDAVVRPLLSRPKRLQVAALCYTQDGPKKKVLLITSRDTGRWIIPKGWPIKGLDAPGAAMQEAWEEAGVKDGDIDKRAIGAYGYEKSLKNGLPVPVETLVYPLRVTEMRDDFPEAGQRRRKWVSPAKAARMVNEPELQSILENL